MSHYTSVVIAARHMLNRAIEYKKVNGSWRIHFAVHTDRRRTNSRSWSRKDGYEPPNIAYHWQFMNRYGVTFHASELDKAEDWLIEAYRNNHQVFCLWSKRGCGFAPGEVEDLRLGRRNLDQAKTWLERNQKFYWMHMHAFCDRKFPHLKGRNYIRT